MKDNCFTEESMETHSSILPGESPQTEEPGGLQSMGSQRAGHNWQTKHNCFAILCWSLPCVHMNQTKVCICPLPLEPPWISLYLTSSLFYYLLHSLPHYPGCLVNCVPCLFYHSFFPVHYSWVMTFTVMILQPLTTSWPPSISCVICTLPSFWISTESKTATSWFTRDCPSSNTKNLAS